MRTAAILLTFVVLGLARHASAQRSHSETDGPISDTIDPKVYLYFLTLSDPPTRDFTLTLGGQQFGFRGWDFGLNDWRRSTVCLGPLGERDVSFTATQGLVGVCLMAGLPIMLLALLMARPWRRRARKA